MSLAPGVSQHQHNNVSPNRALTSTRHIRSATLVPRYKHSLCSDADIHYLFRLLEPEQIANNLTQQLLLAIIIA